MTVLRRSLFLASRLLNENLTLLRRLRVNVAVIAGLTVALGLFVVTTEKWGEALQRFGQTVLTAAILGFFAWLIFRLRFSSGKLRDYLARYARDDGDTRSPTASAVVGAIAEELTAKPSQSCLLVSTADIARIGALDTLPPLLAKRNVVPVPVDLRRTHAPVSIPAVAKDAFIRGLVGVAGDQASAARLFASRLDRQKVVVIVRGLDTWSHGLSLRARRDSIGELLRGCLDESLPFVAAAPDELAPSISEVTLLRIPTVARSELVAHVVSLLQARGLQNDTLALELEGAFTQAFSALRDPTRDPAFLELAADLLIARNRRGESWAAAVAELFGDDCAARRHLRWMCEWALACRFEEVTGEQSPAAFALRMLGLELHYRQDLPTSYDDVSAPLDPDAQRRFALGVSMLARRRVLAISDDSAVRFAHAGWLALAGALALGLDEHRWSDLLRPGLAQATLDALTAALLIDSARRARSASFLDLLERLQARDPAEISLDMALAVVAALQADEPELVIDREELDVLRRSWLASSDAVRLRFLGTVDFGRNPLLIDFLWSQAGSANSYRVRRAVCETLARLGDATWETLGEQWRDMVERAVALDLSSRVRKRRSDWEQHGRPIASLCWILPLLALRAGEPARAQTAAVLAALHRLTARRDRQPNDSVPDVGLEISLAEGFKIAATKLADSGERAADWWFDAAESVFATSTSWVSRQALLQALALSDRDRARRLLREARDGGESHSLVREAAALALRPERAPGAPKDIWHDDVQALADGGRDLSPEAHRLLAISTLLINLAERAFGENGGEARRDKALTADVLPYCFSRGMYTRTLNQFACARGCGFELCQSKVLGKIGQRDQPRQRAFSRSFVARARRTSTAPLAGGRGSFGGRAFRRIWRDLDRELARSG